MLLLCPIFLPLSSSVILHPRPHPRSSMLGEEEEAAASLTGAEEARHCTAPLPPLHRE